MKFKSPPPLEVLGVELVFFLVVLTLCLIIYFRTKEIEELSQLVSIHYFRNVFLFFALAYFFRLLSMVIRFSRDFFGMHYTWHVTKYIFVFVGYFSTMAILSLALTTVVRKVKRKRLMNFAVYGIPFLVSFVAFLSRAREALIAIHIILLIVAFVVLLRKKKRKYAFNRIVYVLLICFWIITYLASIRFLLPHPYRITLYVISSAIFLSIYLRVNKRLTNGTKKR